VPAEFICDGCGCRAEAQPFKYNSECVYVPKNWWSVYVKEEDRFKYACSRECVQKINSSLSEPKLTKNE
jgi:hypothetical protein